MITTALYVVICTLLWWPLAALCMWEPISFTQYIKALTYPQLWIVMAVLVLAQALFLVVPVKTQGDITLKKRHILTPIVTAAVMMALLVAGVVVSLVVAIFGDQACNVAGWGAIGVMVAAWFFWFFRFRKFASESSEPAEWFPRLTHHLFRGSILELLVAVGCHIIVRRRGDCSAPGFTFLGIVAGIAVMFLSFGPGVFYLFAKRKQQMLPRSKRCDGEDG